MKLRFSGLTLLALLLSLFGCASNSESRNESKKTAKDDKEYSQEKIRITAGDTILYAEMYDNQTARNFLDTLPFTLPTIERSGLAKGIELPHAIEYEKDRLTRDYHLGEIGYWPGGDIAIFYSDDLFDKTIVDVVQIGQITSGIEVFKTYDGSVTIEKADKSQFTEDPLVLKDISEEDKKPARKQGRIESFSYLSNGYQKTANVYLPYGYDEDSDVKYDIFYMMHGGGGNVNTYFGSPSLKDILDNLIEKERLNPMIVVFPTFYHQGSTDYASLTRVFHNELREDLIPQLEGKYHTFLETSDSSGMEASRKHRGFGGFSMGSVTTWYTFLHCLDCFSYFLPMSGDCWEYTARGDENDAIKTAEILSDAVRNSKYGKDFRIHAVTGDQDIAYSSMNVQIEALRKQTDVFDFSPGGNIEYSVLENGSHTSYYAKVYLYNILPAFFHPLRTYEVESSEFIIRSDEAEIYGISYQPKDVQRKMKAVILSHGYGGNYNTNRYYAMEFARHGYFSYAFDFRGGYPSSKSSGTTLEMSVFTEEEDLKRVIKEIQMIPNVDKDHIYLFGTSQGGLVSAMAAADMEKEVSGLILLYPAFVLVDDAKKMYSSVDEIPETVSFLWMTVGKTYFENLLDYDAYDDVRRYRKEVLIFHGDKDAIVPLSYSERAEKEYPSAKLYTLENAGHGFYGKDVEFTFRKSLEYMMK